jgi:hypothetical protein
MTLRQHFPRGASERRRLPRVHVGAVLQLTVQAEGDAMRLVNLSHAGCAVESRDAFTLGDELPLTFALDSGAHFVVPVRVAYSRPAMQPKNPAHACLTGFEFDTLKQPGIHRIVEILLEAANEPLSVH